MRWNSFKSPTNTFLASLATTDLLLIVVCLPVKVNTIKHFHIWTSSQFLNLWNPILLDWNLMLFLQIPFQLFRLFTFTWPFGGIICTLTFYIQDVSVICSVLNLTAMSMERFYAILYPLKSRTVCTVSQAKKVVGTTWLLAFLLALPRIWIQVRYDEFFSMKLIFADTR